MALACQGLPIPIRYHHLEKPSLLPKCLSFLFSGIQCFPDTQNPSLEAAIINSIFYFFPEMFCEGTTAKSISFASSAKHFISDNWTFKSIQLYIKNERHVTVVMNICFHFCQIVIHLKKNAPEW